MSRYAVCGNGALNPVHMSLLPRISRIVRRLRRRRCGEVLPQLRMVYTGPGSPDPGPPLVAPYRLRPYRPGDESAWIALLNGDGRRELGAWTPERLRVEILSHLVTGTQHFVWSGDTAAAGAGVYERSPSCWEVGWVATLWQHRGRGLGRRVTAAAVAAALGLPSRPIFLFTDDFRLPAIRLYLDIGFLPDCIHPSHSDRWGAVFDQLGPRYGPVRSRSNLVYLA